MSNALRLGSNVAPARNVFLIVVLMRIAVAVSFVFARPGQRSQGLIRGNIAHLPESGVVRVPSVWFIVALIRSVVAVSFVFVHPGQRSLGLTRVKIAHRPGSSVVRVPSVWLIAPHHLIADPVRHVQMESVWITLGSFEAVALGSFEALALGSFEACVQRLNLKMGTQMTPNGVRSTREALERLNSPAIVLVNVVVLAALADYVASRFFQEVIFPSYDTSCHSEHLP